MDFNEICRFHADLVNLGLEIHGLQGIAMKSVDFPWISSIKNI